MKKLNLLVLLGLIVTTAQSNSRTQTPTGPKSEPTASQSPELVEASQLSMSAVQLYNDGKFDEAAPLAKRALELREKVLGKDHALVNAAVLNLAEIQYSRRRFDDSRSLFERVLHSYERTLGADDAKVATVLDRLALNSYALASPRKLKSTICGLWRSDGKRSEQIARLWRSHSTFSLSSTSFRDSISRLNRCMSN